MTEKEMITTLSLWCYKRGREDGLDMAISQFEELLNSLKSLRKTYKSERFDEEDLLNLSKEEFCKKYGITTEEYNLTQKDYQEV